MIKDKQFAWLNYFRPNIFVNSIEDININNFKQQGFRMVICDLDNTLVPHFTKIPTKQAINFVRSIQKQGLLFIVVSNNSKKRVTEFCKILKPDDYVWNAKKPITKKVKKVIQKYNMNKEDVIFIGDQVVTDIWVSNRLQAKSILTLPIVSSTKEKNGWLLNLLDKFIYKYLQHNNMLNDKEELEIEDMYEIL
ncbi:YqeG family HAD IIIA-type phosphatase [Ureaplasma ceti]|uniref:YqeG family HAD IIIA-type phosphatase n=1 Tax=Ureaplasma ceti TaxID=3119530 RepID=A0ABP9UBH1_9BACT